MEWFQTLTIIVSFMAMFLYLASKIDGIRRDINKEMKDFHGRLCAIEERRK